MRLESRTSTLQELYAEESAKIRGNFEDSGDGKAAIRSRSSLIDSVVIQLWNEVTATGEPLAGFCIAAMGGYGRRALFPYSDIDLLFLYEKEGREEYLSKKVIAPLSQSLWDLHLRVSPTTRTLAECGKLHRGNIEFNISLLDCRYICGDEKLYERLRTRVLPAMVIRESEPLMQELTGLALARHQKYGQTIFHLEPSIKDGPGGLRDYEVACWLSQIEEMQRSCEWEDPRVMFRLFEFVARHNLKLTAETENAVETALPRIQKWNSSNPDLWEYLREILVLPHAATSLRPMHRVGLLVLLFKEFQMIDS